MAWECSSLPRLDLGTGVRNLTCNIEKWLPCLARPRPMTGGLGMGTAGGASFDRNDWSGWWLLMWVVTTPIWITTAFLFPIAEEGNWWKAPGAFLVLFLVPEMISIFDNGDGLPPLTHAIRGFIPTDFAFPLIYLLIGAVGGCWFGFPTMRYVGLGVLFAILGWLTIHFTIAYMGPDPRPRRSRREGHDALERARPRAGASQSFEL